MNFGFKGLFIAALAAGLMSATPSQAIHLNEGDIVRIDVAFSNALPYESVTLVFTYDDYGIPGDESFKLKFFNANDVLLETRTSSVTLDVFSQAFPFISPSTPLTTTSYYALLTAETGSFDILTARGTAGAPPRGFGFEQVDAELRYEFQAAPVPGPTVGAGLPGLILAGGLLGWSRRRRIAA